MYVFSDEDMLAIVGFSRPRADLLDGEFTSIINLINNSPSVSFGYYDVRSYGITMNSTAAGSANTTAFQALLDTIKNSGIRGSIKIPDGKLYLNSRIGVGDPNLASVRFQGHNDISIRGNGDSSQIIWQGSLQSTSKHLFWLSGAYVGAVTPGIQRATTKGVTFENLWIGIGDITNRDTGSEQNHLIRVATDQRGDVEGLRIINCTFGVTGGDAVALSGDGGAQNGSQISWASDILIQGCRFNGYDHAATVAPTYGYRTCVSQKQNTRRIRIEGCYLTGSDDALLDLEPTGGTTPNGNDDLCIVGNTLVPSAPGGGNAFRLCVQVSGNGHTDGDYVQGLNFVGNTIKGGRMFCIRTWRCNISNNNFYGDTGGALPDAMLQIQTRHNAMNVVGNHFFAPVGFVGNNLLLVDHDTYNAGETGHVNVIGNTFDYTDLGTSTVVSLASVDFVVADNKIYSRKATTNVGTAIFVSATANDIRANVHHNQIYGDFGGGSLQYGVQFAPDTKQMRCEASGNVGTGTATAGIRLAAPSGGAYSEIPIVVGNSLPNGVSHATGGAAGHWMIGGNAGGVTITVGNNGSPEGAVTAIQGSEHVRRNGDSTTKWDKTTGTGNTGWVQRTIP